MSEKKTKEVFKKHIICPHCKKRIIVKKTKKLLKEAIKAEYDEKLIVEKDSQKTLSESVTKGKKKLVAELPKRIIQ